MEKFDYKEKLNSLRMNDSDGDLSYTIHISNAIDVCTELENHYLNEMINLQTARLAGLQKKQEQIDRLKDLIRSAHEIATREGKETNWEAFLEQCQNILN